MKNASRIKAVGLLMAGLALVLSACSQTPTKQADVSTCVPTVPPFIGQRSIDVPRPDGSVRSFEIRIPSALDRTEAASLILVFHGLGGTAESILDLGRFDKLAQESAAIVVAPQGTKAEFAKTGWSLEGDGFAEDTEFINRVIEEVEDLVCVNPNRVFAMGFSNGSVFAQKYACLRESPIGAVAGIAGPLQTHECLGGPVPLIYFHGTGDTIVPFNGGQTLIGELAGVRESLSAWAEVNGCTGKESTDAFDSQTERTSWADCPNGNDVRAYLTVDGGHRWPGGYLTQLKAAHGTVESNIDATTQSWRFFERVSRNRERS